MKNSNALMILAALAAAIDAVIIYGGAGATMGTEIIMLIVGSSICNTIEDK